jgi:hypothetical protein
MTVLTTEAIDRELALRADEIAAMSGTLIGLDDHPGLGHVRRYSPSGETAKQWVMIESQLAQLWEDLGLATSVLDSARAIRARRSKLADGDRTELTRLLSERVLADIVDRMRATHPVVAAFFDAVDGIDALIATRLAPLQKRLDEAGVVGPKEINELLRTSATDPLSLTHDVIKQRIAVIADDVERQATELAELAALQANWPAALAATVLRLDALRETTRHVARVRIRAEQTVAAGPLPMHGDAEPALRAELESLEAVATQSISAPVPTALLSLQRRIDAALQVAGEDERLAQGLLDRHRELKGRLTVYQAKAARLGFGENPDLLASGRIAAGLLSRRPCDLRAVTRAVSDFQQMIVEKQGTPR